MGSLYLSATPTVWSGAARLLDFGNTFDSYTRTETGRETDALGIFWDWVVVGDALWQAFSEYQGDVGLVSTTQVEVPSR